MNNPEIMKILLETVEIISILNELLKKETMINADYNGIYNDLKWNKVMLRNRLDSLNESYEYVEKKWKTGKEYMEKINEKQGE